MTREQIATEALTWIGTPFRHQARLKGIGVDCSGIVVGILRHFGVPHEDPKAYSRGEAGKLMKEGFDKWLLPVEEVKVGSVLLLGLMSRREPVHCGVMVTPFRFVHADTRHGVRKVILADFGPYWQNRLCGVYDIPGVE